MAYALGSPLSCAEMAGKAADTAGVGTVERSAAAIEAGVSARANCASMSSCTALGGGSVEEVGRPGVERVWPASACDTPELVGRGCGPSPEGWALCWLETATSATEAPRHATQVTVTTNRRWNIHSARTSTTSPGAAGSKGPCRR